MRSKILLRAPDARIIRDQSKDMRKKATRKGGVGRLAIMDDREDAVVRLNAIKQFMGYDKDSELVKVTQKSLDMAIKAIDQTTWIPCSERLPEDRREVLVTAYWHETYQVMMASYYGDGLWWCVPFNNCGEHMQRLNPKAWMPLPKPYKVENEDKE